MSTDRKILGLLTAADLTALLLCLFAATVFWFFNAMNHHDYTGEIYYPVKVEYPKENLIPVKPLPTKIRFNATGSGWVILRKSLHLYATPLVIHPIGIPAKKVFTEEELLPSLSHQLSDIKINFLLSDTLILDFDYIGKKQVALRLDTADLSLADNYRIVTPVYIEPDTITLSGALEEIKKTPNVLYLKLQQKNLKGTFSDDVLLDGFKPHVSSSVQSVHVGFGAKHFITYTKSFPICLINFPGNASIQPKEEVKIDFIVSEDNEETLSNEDLKVCVDYAKLDSGNRTVVPIVVNIPSYVRSYTTTPGAIKVYYAE